MANAKYFIQALGKEYGRTKSIVNSVNMWMTPREVSAYEKGRRDVMDDLSREFSLLSAGTEDFYTNWDIGRSLASE